MELMMCGGLFTITYENSAESIPLLLFGQSKGTSQNCTKLCPIKTRPTLSIKHKLSPSLHSYDGDDCTFSLTRFFFSLSLWMRERGGECEYDPAYQMCHNRADWCFRLSIPSHWQAVTCWLPRRSSPVRAGAHQSQSRVSGEHAHRLFDEIWQQMSQRSKTAVVFATTKPILSFWIMIMQNSVTRITGDESLSFLSSHPTREDSPLM